MDIDIERLKVDESLWPEGKWYWCGRPWVRGFHSDHEPCSECIPRPTNPEWVDGLPPVGLTNEQFTLMTRISCACNDHKETHYKVAAHFEGHAVVVGRSGVSGGIFAHAVPPSSCRPIQTPKQRQREELHELLLPAVRQLKHNNGSEGFVFAYDAEETLTILSKYNLTEK